MPDVFVGRESPGPAGKMRFSLSHFGIRCGRRHRWQLRQRARLTRCSFGPRTFRASLDSRRAHLVSIIAHRGQSRAIGAQEEEGPSRARINYHLNCG